MNNHQPSEIHNDLKWQKMSAMVNQYSSFCQPVTAGYLKKTRLSRWIAENGLIFLLQYIGLMFATLNQHLTPIYFASGTACAFMFLRGCNIVPGIWLGTFLAYYFLHVGFQVSFACATLFTLQPLLLLWVSHRYICPTLIVRDRSLLVKFFLLSIVVTGVISFELLQFCYPLLRTSESFTHLWLQWWLANINGILIVSYAILTLDMYFPQAPDLKLINYYALLGWFSVFIFLCCALMIYPLQSFFYIQPICLFAMVMLIGMKFKWPGVVLANFIFGLMMTVGASLGWFEVTLGLEWLVGVCAVGGLLVVSL